WLQQSFYLIFHCIFVFFGRFGGNENILNRSVIRRFELFFVFFDIFRDFGVAHLNIFVLGSSIWNRNIIERYAVGFFFVCIFCFKLGSINRTLYHIIVDLLFGEIF